MPVFALVDANNFYASCEKLFNPKLKDRPVVVLSNNDGCVVARSAEAKALGIAMGVPWFKIRDEARRHRIVAFSSNYALYADMSNRLVNILSGFSPNIEVYGIDESFLDLSGLNQRDHAVYGTEIRQRVADWLGLAVCVGIGPTKTMAKLANHCAKKALAGQDGVCDLNTLSPEALNQLLSRIEVGEVWGIGRKLAPRLNAMGIHNVRQLRDADAETLRTRFSVVLERTVRELLRDLLPGHGDGGAGSAADHVQPILRAADHDPARTGGSSRQLYRTCRREAAETRVLGWCRPGVCPDQYLQA